MAKQRLLNLAFGLAILLNLVLLRAGDPLFVRTIREMTFDQFQRLSPRPHVEQPVRVVDIDEESLAQFGQWPWPRDRLAELSNSLFGIGAAAIAFDVVFAEPDRLSPLRILQASATEKLLGNGHSAGGAFPDTDREFASALAERPVVLAFSVTRRSGEAAPLLKSGFAFTGEQTLDALPRFEKVTPILPELAGAAQGIGSMSLSPGESSGTVRKIPLMLTDGTKAYPSLSLEALRVALGASTYLIRGAADTPAAVEDIRVGGLTVPTTRNAELWLYYRHDSADLYVSAADVLAGKEPDRLREKLEGHIVFIGTSAPGLIDIRGTALAQNVPGVSIHAQAIEQILSGTFLWRPDWADGAEILSILVVGLLIISATVFLAPSASLLIGAAAGATVAGGAWLVFRNYGLLIDLSFPLAAGIVVHFCVTAYRYLVTDRDARFVRQAFSHYVSPPVLEQLQKRPETLKLGGDVRELTVMFVDVRDFTPISERLAPEELVGFINRLLGELSHCVVAEDGTIDKYIGDSLMAFWNAPMEVEDHQRRACLAGLKMRERVARLNAENAFGFRGRGLPWETVNIGIGISTGRACVGNMGSEERFNYSCIGDAVNVAARVESACKHIGFDLLASADTVAALAGMALIEGGALPLKGKIGRQSVFLVVGDAATRVDAAFVKLAGRHQELLAAIRQGNASEIERLTGECTELSRLVCEPLAGFYRRIPHRLADFRGKVSRVPA